jgi:hypothetical protein
MKNRWMNGQEDESLTWPELTTWLRKHECNSMRSKQPSVQAEDEIDISSMQDVFVLSVCRVRAASALLPFTVGSGWVECRYDIRNRVTVLHCVTISCCNPVSITQPHNILHPSYRVSQKRMPGFQTPAIYE